MTKESIRTIFLPVFIIFIIINCFCIVFGNFLESHKIDHLVLIVSNALLFALTFFNLFIYQKTMSNTNPNVFFRSVMAATVIKLFFIAAAVCMYLYFAGANKSLYAIICTMFLYVFYTVAEVRNALKLNRQTNVRS